MPKGLSNYKRKPICWWTQPLNSFREDKQHKRREFKRNPTVENFMKYKRANVLFKRETKISNLLLNTQKYES